MRNGKIEVAEITGSVEEEGSSFATNLCELDAHKKDGLISEDEYQIKRVVIMQEK